MLLKEASEVMPDLDRIAIIEQAKPFDPLTRLAEFTSRFPVAIEILRVGGVHPTEDAKMDNPYTGKPHDESFTNIGEHCLAVASLASTLAFRLHERGALSVAEAELVTSRALIHDANKRIEIMRRNAVREGVVEEAYTPKAYETIKPILEARGVDPELVNYMVDAGKETGHLSIRDFLMLVDGAPTLVPNRMAERIIHLADDMTSTSIPNPGERPLTVYLTTWERMVASEFPNRYPFLWKEGLAFDKDGGVTVVQDIESADRSLRWIGNYAYWQPSVSNEICGGIQSMIDPGNKQRPEYFVKDLVNNALVPATNT
ncbi:MAG: hypothetical protein PHE48_02405 [Candidatus Daviesbacteria bacterium]|nr:hypothetical protein [Candidatus Daviesbacteria bacterium]